MTINKRKKNTRHRGTRTCGWGLTHRGSGDKGGKGNAGSGKRGDSKKQMFEPTYFGKTGFKIERTKTIKNTINIQKVMENIKNWKEEKDGKIIIDLKKRGYTKLLSQGKPNKKIKIIINKASKNTIEKLKKAECELVTQ